MTTKKFVQTCTTLETTNRVIASLAASLVPPENTYYVSRNVGKSGDGKSWDEAFVTIGEAVAAVNLAYDLAQFPTRGRNTVIVVDEGWYSETPLTLTASDCHIIAAAPGSHDSTVLYGSATAGGFDGPSGAPALTSTGSNNTIEGLGMFTHDPLFPSLSLGVNGTASFGNKAVGCSFIRDVDDGSLGGVLDLGEDGSVIEGCFFSTSCKDYGIRTASNGLTNPVNPVYKFNRFVGCPAGIVQDAGHDVFCHGNWFMDDTSDRPGTMATPIVCNATSNYSSSNWSMSTNKAGIVTGAGTIAEAGNYGTDSAT